MFPLPPAEAWPPDTAAAAPPVPSPALLLVPFVPAAPFLRSAAAVAAGTATSIGAATATTGADEDSRRS